MIKSEVHNDYVEIIEAKWFGDKKYNQYQGTVEKNLRNGS